MVTPAMDAIFVTEVKGQVEEDREACTSKVTSLEITSCTGNLSKRLLQFDKGAISGEELFIELVELSAVIQRAATEGISDLEYDFPKRFLP